MLINFKIKNFRSIKEEVILDLAASADKTMADEAVFDRGDISLIKVLAIYGANASGKSNILKAFSAMRIMMIESLLRSNIDSDLPNEFFKLSSSTENKPSSFEINFSMNGKIYSYGFEIDKKSIVSEHFIQKKGNKSLFDRLGQDIKSNKNYLKEATAGIKNQTSERSLFLTVLASNNVAIAREVIAVIKSTNIIIGTEVGSTLNYSFSQYLNNADMALKMRDFTIKADFGVVDIQASEKTVSVDQIKNIPEKFKEAFFKDSSTINQLQLTFLHRKYLENGKETNLHPLDFFAEESYGTQQFFALSAPIIDTLQNGKVLFIDEIDTCLHPMLSQYLISIFNSKAKNPNNAQLVFTTHSLSHLKEEYLRRDQIYFTDKNDQGATELYSLSEISERKGVDFSKRYIEGRYGALPYIADFEDLKFNKS